MTDVSENSMVYKNVFVYAHKGDDDGVSNVAGVCK